MEGYNGALFMLTISGAVIMILISIVGFFIKPLIKSIDELKDTISELKLVVELQKQDSKNFNKLCEMKHSEINKRLIDLEEK